MKEFEYDGRTYRSLNALAEAVGMNSETLRKRIKRGLSVKEAVEAPPVPLDERGRMGRAASPWGRTKP